MANSPSSNSQGLTFPLKMWKMVVMPNVVKKSSDEDDDDVVNNEVKVKDDEVNTSIANLTIDANPDSVMSEFDDL